MQKAEDLNQDSGRRARKRQLTPSLRHQFLVRHTMPKMTVWNVTLSVVTYGAMLVAIWGLALSALEALGR